MLAPRCEVVHVVRERFQVHNVVQRGGFGPHKVERFVLPQSSGTVEVRTGNHVVPNHVSFQRALRVVRVLKHGLDVLQRVREVV